MREKKVSQARPGRMGMVPDSFGGTQKCKKLGYAVELLAD